MTAHTRTAAVSIMLLAVAGMHTSVALAQNDFGGTKPLPASAARQPTPPPDGGSKYGNAPAPTPDRNAPRAASEEGRDFGVAPQRELKPSNQLHGPTPTQIPGGQVITTQALAQLVQNKQSGALLLHVYGPSPTLPDAKLAGPASLGGSFDDTTQQEFGQYLQQITGGDKSRTLVTYCEGVQCWMSYNAALRAINMGYKNVRWYRGGMEAWRQAGLPFQQK